MDSLPHFRCFDDLGFLQKRGDTTTERNVHTEDHPRRGNVQSAISGHEDDPGSEGGRVHFDEHPRAESGVERLAAKYRRSNDARPVGNKVSDLVFISFGN